MSWLHVPPGLWEVLPELFNGCSTLRDRRVVQMGVARFLPEDATSAVTLVSLKVASRQRIHRIAPASSPAAGVLINGEGCRRPLIARLIRLREPDRAETSLAS